MTTRVHGTAVAIGGRAVLITGAPGSGKSDLALRLVDRGAVLVADDYVELTPAAGAPGCAPPPAIAGKLEVRGLGIATLPFVRDVPLALVVDLDAERPRLPEPRMSRIAGADVPMIAVDARAASAPILVELALTGQIAALD
jgi:serine kinase of HPr protein (carbohydrate metabolism regulator)